MWHYGVIVPRVHLLLTRFLFFLFYLNTCPVFFSSSDHNVFSIVSPFCTAYSFCIRHTTNRYPFFFFILRPSNHNTSLTLNWLFGFENNKKAAYYKFSRFFFASAAYNNAVYVCYALRLATSIRSSSPTNDCNNNNEQHLQL